MPTCLFHHLFKNSIENAVTHLKSVCQDENTSAHQKEFNVDSQIPLMSQTLQNITNTEVDELSHDWANFRCAISAIIEETKSTIEAKQKEKQAACGSQISIEHTNSLCSKILRMYDEMRTQISAPLFSAHGDETSSKYTNSDYSKSSHLNQLIYIALDYRFNKIQEKIVNNVVDYTHKHKAKWKALTETILLWQFKIQTAQAYDTQRLLMVRDIKALLNQLLSDERCIQNEVKAISQNTTFSIFKSYAKTTLTYLLENESSLRSALDRLVNSYLATCEYDVVTEANNELGSKQAFSAKV